MQGIFTAVVHDASGFGKTPEEMDRPYIEAMERGRLQEFLDSLPVAQKVVQKNLVFQTMARALLEQCFGITGFGAYADGGASHIDLTTIATEPVYTEAVSLSGNVQSSNYDTDSVNASYLLWKYFFTMESEPYRIWSDPDGREGYYWRSRFLWLPSHGLMSNIRGARCHYNNDADNGTGSQTGNPSNQYGYRTILGRTRFKDSGGSPITMEKTASQSFLVEYLLKFYSR